MNLPFPLAPALRRCLCLIEALFGLDQAPQRKRGASALSS